MKTLLALEHRSIEDMSFPGLNQLAEVSNVETGEFMERIYKLWKAGKKHG